MMRDIPPDHWTPELVEERLVDAVRWLRFAGAAVGPAKIRSGQPDYRPAWEDYFCEGWGFPEFAPVDERDIRPAPTRAQVAQHEAALNWVGDIVLPVGERLARAVNAWIASKAYDRPFRDVLRDRGISRTFAYSLKDRALVIVSIELDARGVPAWGE